MRIPTLFVALTVLIFGVAGAAWGEATPRGETDLTLAPESAPVDLPRATHLTLSPLFIEILAIEEQARETEISLLKELAATTDAAEAARIVRSLERLDTDRRLKVLKVRMEYARKTGHFDLALRLRSEITTLMTQDMQAMK